MPRIVVFLIVLFVSACGQSEQDRYQPAVAQNNNQHEIKEYVVGIHPLHNPKRLMAVYGPIIEHINLNIPQVHFKVEASRNYEEFDKKLYSGHFDFAMPNPYQSVMSLGHGYRIFGKMGDDEDFRGIILVRKDSNIREVTDLKGKVVSYPAKTALAATMQPQHYLHTHGIDINKDIENRYVGSQESSIVNVFRGNVAAGATWPIPWRTFKVRHPDMARELIVKWKTDPLVNNGWVVRKDIPTEIVSQFSALLFNMHESEQGRAMLAQLPVSRFEPASDETYSIVRTFLEEFSKNVRKIPTE